MEKVLAFFSPSLFISRLSGGGLLISHPKPFKILRISRFF